MGNTASDMERRESKGESTQAGGRGEGEGGEEVDGGQGDASSTVVVEAEGEREREGEKEREGEERSPLSYDDMVRAASEEALPQTPTPSPALPLPSPSSSSSSNPSSSTLSPPSTTSSSTSATAPSSYSRPRAASSISTTPSRDIAKAVTPQISRRYRESESLVIQPISQIVRDQKQRSFDMLSRNPIDEDTFIVATAARRQALLRQYQHLADVVYADECSRTFFSPHFFSHFLSFSLSLFSVFLSLSLSPHPCSF